MALLHSSDALFYHPLETNKVESTKGLTWNEGGFPNYVDGVFGKGLSNLSSSTIAQLAYHSGSYASCSGDTSWTVAFWMKDQNNFVTTVHFGWDDAPFGSPSNGLSMATVNSSQRNQFQFWSRGSNANINETRNWGTGSGLFVIRAEFDGTNCSGWYSINGSGWTSLGTVTLSKPDGQGSGVFIAHELITNSPPTIDEVVFWRNTPIFDHTELSNLFKLGTIYQQTMDNYSTVFSAGGAITASGSCPFYVGGYTSASGSVSCFASGVGFVSGSMPMVIPMPDAVSGSMSLYLHNHQVSGLLPIYLMCNYASGSVPLYLKGTDFRSRSLFLKTREPGVSGFVHLYTYGSSGMTVSSQLGELDMFVSCDVALSNTAGSGLLFLKTSPTGPTLSTASSGTLFLKSDSFGANGVRGSMPLYLRAPTSASGVVKLFVRGAGAILSVGYTPIWGSGLLFMKVKQGTVNELPLVVTGFTYPSGDVSLYLFGHTGSTSGSIGLYLPGYKTDAESLNLYLFGVSGVPSGSLPCYLNVTDTATLTREMGLYTHGY